MSQVVAVPDGAVDALRGTPDPACLPDLRPAFAAALDYPQTSYGDRLVVPELERAARVDFEADGIDAAHLTVTSGSMDAIDRVIDAAELGRGARVGVEDPGHVPVHQLVRSAGLEAVPLAVDEFGVVPHALDVAIRHGLDAVIVTPRCQNPTGAAFDTHRASELSSILATSPDLLVIQDDHAGAISGVDFAGLTSSSRRWVTIRSLGKAYGPDLRLALMASDPQTHGRVSVSISNGPGWVSHVLQRAAAFLLTDDASRAAVRAAADSYAERRALLIGELARRGVRATGRSGLNVWLPVADEQAVIEVVRSSGYAIRAADPYRIDSSPAVRLTISTLDSAQIVELADALASVESGSGRAPSM